MTYLVRKGRQEETQLRSLRFIALVGRVAAPYQEGEGRKKHKWVSIDTSRHTVFSEKRRGKGNLSWPKRCVRGSSCATELLVVVQGCSHTMVGAKLWLFRSISVKKAEYGS